MKARVTTKNARGSALVLALIVVVIVGSLGLGYLRMATAVTDRQAGEVDSMKSFYLCEAGLAEAFQAVRVGRTGQLASEEAPALYGDGLLWVDAIETADSQVRLTSTALVGSGRSSLSLVVEPIEIPLGFYSEEDLVIDTVLLVDGFDSSEGTYADQLAGTEEITVDPETYEVDLDPSNSILFYRGVFYRYTGYEGNTYAVDRSVSLAALSQMPGYDESSYFDIETSDFDPFESDLADEEYEGVLHYLNNVAGPEVATEVGDVEAIGETTGGGGLLASNGDIVIQAGAGESMQIFGEVIPGPGGVVQQSGDVTITGSTNPRNTVIDLPEVTIPAVVKAPSVRHEDLLPLVVPPGESGHSQIVVADGAELILTGPATVVIGDLVLEPGGLMTLDTRNGDVALYVTEGIDLQPGSLVENTGVEPSETSIQVANIASGEDGAPVKLNATSQFHGTIYAPETEVDLGGSFELYGGVVARKLNVGAGARLHFDQADVSDSPIPKLVSWKIVELSDSVAGVRGNPFDLLGVDRDSATALSEAHDLDFVHLMVDYIGPGGLEQSYMGFESEFDWSQVEEVTNVSREPTREKEEGADDSGEPGDFETPFDPTAGAARPEVLDAIQNMHGGELGDWLRTMVPLKSTEVVAMLDDSIMSSNEAKGVLDDTLIGNDGYVRLLSDSHLLTTAHLKELLISKSPLPADIIPYVENADSSLLSPDQKTEILAAQ